MENKISGPHSLSDIQKRDPPAGRNRHIIMEHRRPVKRQLCPTALLTALFAALALLPTVSAQPKSTVPRLRPPAQERTRIPPPDFDAVELATGNARFACDLYAQLKTSKGNLFFSPFSVSSALAMTSAGARGETATQMEKALRVPFAAEKLPPAYCALLAHLDAVQTKGHVQLGVANSLWPQKEFAFLDSYLALAKEYYHAAATPLDYKQNEPAARAAINGWVAEKTKDKIQNLIAGPLNANTRLVLVNAVYFKGDWALPFEKENTRSEPFYRSENTSVDIPLMHHKGNYRYAESDGIQILELPYAGRDLSMFVLLPVGKTPEALATVEQALSVENFHQWRSKMRSRAVILTLPKFKITWGSTSLLPALKALGMGGAFSLAADFSGLTGAKGLFVDEVFHKAFVDVNETGTEAAAATSVGMRTTSIQLRPPPPVMFRADHPFLFFIQENSTRSILFMGRVAAP